MFCPICGAINHDDAKFCWDCGSPLSLKQASKVTPGPIASPAPSSSKRSRVGKTVIILAMAIAMVILVAGIPLALTEIVNSSKKIDTATRPVSEMVLSSSELGPGWMLEKITYNNKTGSVTAIYVDPEEYQFTISIHSCSSKNVALNQIYSNFTAFTAQAKSGRVIVTNVSIANGTDSSFMEKSSLASSTAIMFSKGNIVVGVNSQYGLYGNVEDSYMLNLAAVQAGKIF